MPWRGMAGAVRLGMTRATYPRIHSRTSPASIWIATEGPIFAHQAGRERDHMKLWKCDAVGPIEGVLSITVVVMAETRQQAIEKASAELSAKLRWALGEMFPEDGDRRLAQLRPDILDDMEEVPDEVTIAVVGLPVLEDSTDTPHTGSASV